MCRGGDKSGKKVTSKKYLLQPPALNTIKAI
jgi:hypothetical protein